MTKIITRNGNRSHATRFQGKCACLLSRQTYTCGYLLSRQVELLLHHWCYATLLEDLGYDRELNENKSFESLQAQHSKHIFSFKKTPLIQIYIYIVSASAKIN